MRARRVLLVTQHWVWRSELHPAHSRVAVFSAHVMRRRVSRQIFSSECQSARRNRWMVRVKCDIFHCKRLCPNELRTVRADGVTIMPETMRRGHPMRKSESSQMFVTSRTQAHGV
jgi:hypothetical protein